MRILHLDCASHLSSQTFGRGVGGSLRNTQELRVEYNVPSYHFKSIRSVFHKHWIHKAQITVNAPLLPVENFGVILPYMWNVFASSTFFHWWKNVFSPPMSRRAQNQHRPIPTRLHFCLSFYRCSSIPGPHGRPL